MISDMMERQRLIREHGPSTPSAAPGFRVKPAAGATRSRPGTHEKLEILARRAAAGEELWHEDDPTIFPPRSRDEAARESEAQFGEGALLSGPSRPAHYRAGLGGRRRRTTQ